MNTKFSFPLQKALDDLASATGGGGDHGTLTGLSDDDHTQYHNDTRGDARYYTKSQVDTSLSGKADTAHIQASSTITDFNSATRAQTEAELIAGSNITITPASSGATRTLTIAAAGGGATNLSYTAATRIIASDTGTDATLPLVVAAGDAGLMSGSDKTKLDGVATGATANAADSALRDRTTHTGTQTAATISDFSTAADARIAAASINALSDVIITAPSNTQVLKYNGTNWVNDTDSTGGGGGGSPILSWMI